VKHACCCGFPLTCAGKKHEDYGRVGASKVPDPHKHTNKRSYPLHDLGQISTETSEKPKKKVIITEQLITHHEVKPQQWFTFFCATDGHEFANAIAELGYALSKSGAYVNKLQIWADPSNELASCKVSAKEVAIKMQSSQKNLHIVAHLTDVHSSRTQAAGIKVNHSCTVIVLQQFGKFNDMLKEIKHELKQLSTHEPEEISLSGNDGFKFRYDRDSWPRGLPPSKSDGFNITLCKSNKQLSIVVYGVNAGRLPIVAKLVGWRKKRMNINEQDWKTLLSSFTYEKDDMIERNTHKKDGQEDPDWEPEETKNENENKNNGKTPENEHTAKTAETQVPL
jgi:hypothetical protein